ncbi:MAG: glycoside hydrolase family 26 protein [Oscillospiraceae bacterium]|nr:glycoside hydrolase family 26 protein [Oscillospiraceae bacterium]
MKKICFVVKIRPSDGQSPPLGLISSFALFVILTLFAAILAGCSDIDYPPRGVDLGEVTAGQLGHGGGAEPLPEDKYRLARYDVTPTPFSEVFRFEPPMFAAQHAEEEDERGFTLTVNIPVAQHYAIGLKGRALTESAVAELVHDGVQIGAFFLHTAQEAEVLYLAPVYLPRGEVELEFRAVRGIAAADSVIIEDTRTPDTSRFAQMSRFPVSPRTSVQAEELFAYIVSQFGKRVLTGVHVTSGTNAEIDAIFAATDRRPAIRFSELTAVQGMPKERELAEDWHSRGGIVGVTWRPEAFTAGLHEVLDGGRYSAESSGAARADKAFIDTMLSSGEITEGLVQLIEELDTLAETLGELEQSQIPVLFAPFPDGASRLQWWGQQGGESYARLWRLAFTRLAEYHELSNLIWVWSGGSKAHYPGDPFVDIIAESLFSSELRSGSAAVRFGYSFEYAVNEFGERGSVKPAAVMRSGGVLPSPDELHRDNAWWAFLVNERGDFIIDGQGRLLPEVERATELFYNHELTITLDALR